MKKTTLYWILGGVGAVAVGTGLYFVLRPSTPAMGGGGKTLPQGGGGGGGGTPPPAPNPQNYGQPTQQNNQQLLNDIAGWVGAMKSLQLTSELINSLYKSVQVIAANLGFLLPANPLPVW